MAKAKDSENIHAGCVCIEGVGVLLSGGPKAGKSDLTLRLMESGWQLVSDDRTELVVNGDRVMASPPPTIAGLMEVRGLGVVKVDYLSDVPVGLWVELTDEKIARMPEPETLMILGIALPVFRLSAFEASAVAKLHMAVRALAGEKGILIE